MSEEPSGNRVDEVTTPLGEPGSGSESAGRGRDGRLPRGEDEATIISNRPPVVPPSQPDAQGRRELGQFASGDRIGPYELIEFVGGGGMGRVFRARDEQLARTVALKILARDQAADAETLLRFRNEACSAARLDHESFARVYGVGEDNGIPYLVFEFIEGTTIRALVEKHGPLPLSDAVNYTLQVADALAHASSRGVVHRDIKPSNVLITREGRAKVIDLGLARLQDAREANSDLTASGVTLGTFDYISPEQARDPRSVDVRSDLYSLGCTFFFMLIGRPPFPEGTVLQKLLQHQGDEPPDVRQFRPDLPEEVVRILHKMLAKNPANRYQTPLELVEPLERLAEHMGLRPIGPGGRIWAAPAAPRVSFLQRHLPWMATVGVFLCAVLVLDLFWSASDARVEQAAAPDKSVRQSLSALPERIAPPSSSDKSAKLSPTVPLSGEKTSPDTTTREAKPVPNGAPADRTTSQAVSPVPFDSPWTEPFVSPLESDPSDPTLLQPGGLEYLWDPSLHARELATSEPGTAAPASPLPPDPGASSTTPTGVLTVADSRGGPRNYSTLAAALGAAAAGDVIELRYSGRRVEKKPITVPAAKLVVRAGQGFAPVVVFQPDESDQVKYPRAMITLSGSELRLVNVALELDIPRQFPVDRWTLLELSRAESLQLERCSLTIRNVYPQETSFLRVRVPAGADVFTSTPAGQLGPPARVDVTDCIVRGDALVVDVDPLQPLRLSWTNGFLSTGQRLLRARGGDKTPAPGESIQIDLKHVTAAVARGLCLLEEDAQARYPLPTYVDCSDSILIARADASLIEQVGQRDAFADESLFQWNGDRNFYHGFSVFWSFEDVETDQPGEPVEFEAWQTRWAPRHETHSRWERVDFQRLPDATRPAHTHTPADYLLNDATENGARGQASDGADVGFLPNRLPPLPPVPENAE